MNKDFINLIIGTKQVDQLIFFKIIAKTNIYSLFIYHQIPMFQQRTFDNCSQTVIINADDFGLASSIDEGIIELLVSKRVSSISAIVNTSNSENGAAAIQKLRNSHPQIFQRTSMGLHFNLTRGQPLSQTMWNSKFTQKGRFSKSVAEQALKQEGHQQEIADEFRMQVRKFIHLFKRRPSHVDGHNHVHIYPSVAGAISGVLSEFGIYKVRMPAQNDLHSFDEFLAINIKAVTQLYKSKNIIWPNIFLGTEDSGNLNVQKIRNSIQRQGQKRTLQLMCHPGYPTQQGSGWTSKSDRLREKQQLQSQQFKHFQNFIGGFSSYFDLKVNNTAKNPLKMLICSKLQIGTGNYTTSFRYKTIFEKMGFQVYTWSVQPEISSQIEIQDLQKFLISFGISLILGINVSRSAKIIYQATHSSQKIRTQVPYILVIAGTDANYTFQNPDKYQELSQCLQWSQCMVSISKDMTKITQKILKELKIEKSIYTIVQSSSLGEQLSGQKHNEEANVTVLPNSNSLGKRFILFPTSFRRIKCVEYIFRQLNELIQKQSIQVFILGPIIEREYYQEIKGSFGRIQYIGTLNQAEYSKKLAEAFAVINCSETEGMSCSILEALQFGVPVVARSNAGNKQLISHNYNGLIFQTPEDFAKNIHDLLEDSTFRKMLIDNGKKIFNENYSLKVQQKQYQCMIQKEIKSKIMELALNNQHIRIFNQPNVHNTSEVNNRLYLQITPKVHSQAKILDFGCGTSVFSLLYLLKMTKINKIQLYLVDIDNKIVGNAIYNCRQTSFWDKLEIIAISDSNFLTKVDKNIEFDAILFNPPQTPFRNPANRLDKNGGITGIKFHELILNYFSESNNKNLYLLYSYMAWPSKVKEILSNHQLKYIWRSSIGVHKISKQDYDKMQVNLSDFILQHWKQGKAEIQVEGDQFFVPAEVQLIMKNDIC